MSVLPAAQQAGRIAEKVQENPITLITGDTGCGKSTQVPRILLESMRGRILCTQPRRLAVMGVASRVAEELGETLGGDIVGYHVGNQRAGDDGTRLMFATAGVVLEILKKEGLRVLARYSAIIVDEVHERSVENDLLLACIRRLLPKAGEQRLVLMSATADVMRLRTFFSSLEVVALAASSAIWNTRELYLRQALEFATSHLRERDAKDSAAADEKLRRQVEALAHEPQELSLLQPLITRLVLQLLLKMHKGEAEAPKRGGGDEESSGRTVLVFLPTYATLESQYDSLHRTLPLGTPLHLLHSSVDLEGALAEMSADAPTAPRVVLASSVAESSVTIEGVAHVIDSCRANEVYFSGATQATNARLVWVSVSQADQRRGRTGRTCHGSCWRLLPRSFFKLELELYEQPAVQLLPLRKECLALSCADDPRIADAPAVFQATIDPPAPRNVEAAFRKLEQMGAVHEEALPVPRRQRKQLGAVAGASRFVPTTLGTICDAMPVDLESSLFVLHCLRAHLLPEAVLLASLNCTTPLVLVRRPLELEQYERLVERFGPGATRVARGLAPQDVDLLANLAAYHCHRRLLLDPQRWRRAGMLYAADESGGGGVQLEAEFEELDEVEAEEEGWFCDAEQLSRTSLHAVARTAEQVLCALCERNPPLLNRALEYSEREISPVVGGGDELFAKLVPLQVVRRVAPLLAFLRPDGALAADKVSPTAELSRQDATMSALAAAIGGGAPAAAAASGVTPPSRSFKPKQVACSFFLRGACNRGGDCPFAHTFGAERPICKYAQAGTCKFGGGGGLPCTFPVPSLYLPCTFPVPSLQVRAGGDVQVRRAVHVPPSRARVQARRGRADGWRGAGRGWRRRCTWRRHRGRDPFPHPPPSRVRLGPGGEAGQAEHREAGAGPDGAAVDAPRRRRQHHAAARRRGRRLCCGGGVGDRSGGFSRRRLGHAPARVRRAARRPRDRRVCPLAGGRARGARRGRGQPRRPRGQRRHRPLWRATHEAARGPRRDGGRGGRAPACPAGVGRLGAARRRRAEAAAGGPVLHLGDAADGLCGGGHAAVH